MNETQKETVRCDCGWIGNFDQTVNQSEWGCDQELCPACRDVLRNNFTGTVYCEVLVPDALAEAEKEVGNG